MKAVFFDFDGGMCKPLSEDLRKRIVAERNEGHTTAEVSRIFGVSMRNLIHDKLGIPSGLRLDAHQEEISNWIAKEPGLTLE